MSLGFNGLRVLLLTGLFAAFVADATQVMHRPDNYKNVPHKYTLGNVTPQLIHKRSGSKVQAAYFTNWGIYGANFQPTDIVSSDLTHILYAFADVSPDTGAISLTDSYADEQKHFPSDSWSETGNNLYGCLKQLYLLKLANRNLKVTLSIGGWTYSQSGHFNFVTDANKRATFVSSALKLVEDYGFDGIDLDFEYPANTAQGQGFADLLTALRTGFDNYAKNKGDNVPYLITAAVAAGSANYAFLPVAQMDKALSYWNLMAYDYAGSWLTYADNQANLYGGTRTGVSTDAAVKFYTANGATPGKINLGIPLYGRAFEATSGIGQPFNGIGPGTVEAGIYSYSALPLAGAQVFENLTDVTSYSYDSAKKELVSYDTPHIVQLKAQYVSSKGLAGTMFWDLSTDKTGSSSLVQTAASVYGTLDQTQNHIHFPNSKWDNIRSNMGSVSNPGSPTSAPPPPPTGPTGSPGGGSGSCAGVAAWASGSVYTGGQTAVFNGHLWTAKWWTQGDTPGGAAGVWTDNGAC
ncbi:glycoside hydrolase family 18 protein [Cristinia sonorae]|uniref:Glycoside hydrolase family 18 protein n=1 Tax=Cristinia sonorae TaxID=1940300 RepID=A0A8K0UT15_9AGAR|nr:glycoside hydrolase family 18 protein [Cristinia sonorae]